MKVLGIETSCDETAAAVVENGATILSSIVASSAEIHVKTGGIIPEQAARAQIQSLLPVIEAALKKAGIELKDVDSIAVTTGPGLIGSLLVGVETAKVLSFFYKKPIIPVNHLVGHIYANWLSDNPSFPCLALVVSGGHTDLVLMKNHGELNKIGATRDDAAGEAFDKTARLLGLPYPGGPAIEKDADIYFKINPNSNSQKLNLFPRPMIEENNFDWSFSGLKTAVMREVESKHSITTSERSELAAQVQEAIVDVLITKSLKAIKKYKPKSFLLSGGVAANKRLKKKFGLALKQSKLKTKLYVPEPKLCTDNASYIASCAFFNPSITPWKNVYANPQLTISSSV